MTRAIHIARDQDVLLSGVVEDGALTDLMAERISDAVRPGDVYRARVERVLRDAGAAYVELGLDRLAYLADPGPAGRKDILVQVTRSARDGKAIEVTREIALPGTMLVFRPLGAGISVTRRLDPSLARHWQPSPPGGWIIRAAAQDATDADLAAEAERLSESWKAISQSADDRTPRRLMRGPDVGERLILDTPRVTEVRINDKHRRRSLTRWLETTVPAFAGRVDGDPMDLREEVPALLLPEVPLSNEGSIVIEKTRALTAIDVNAGAAPDVTQVNREAVRVIARQLRLRNIGGVVVVDFISMKRRDSRNAIVELMRGLLDDDPARVRTARGLSGLGLFEFAREHRGSALADVMAAG